MTTFLITYGAIAIVVLVLGYTSTVIQEKHWHTTFTGSYRYSLEIHYFRLLMASIFFPITFVVIIINKCVEVWYKGENNV